MATITIEIPDDLVLALGKTDEERTRFMLEAVALDCFQVKRWSKSSCGKMLGMPRMGFDELLMKRGIPDNLTGSDVVDAYKAMSKLIAK